MTSELVAGPARVTRDLLLIAALGALVNFPFLGQEDHWDTREVRHATIAAEMAADGDFLVPHLLGQPYIFKQPVMHAPVALLYRLCGGPSMLLARLPSALAGIVCAFLLYGLGRVFYERRAALLGALILLATPAHAVLSRTARPDMLFTVALLASVYGLAAGVAASRPLHRAGWLACGGLMAGLAVLAKGPYGVFYPAVFSFTVAVLAPLGREDLKRPRVHEWLCFGLGLLVIPLAWGIPVYLRDDGAYLRLVFGQHNAGTSAHVRPFYYYLGPGLKMLLPWALLLPFMWVDARARPAVRPCSPQAFPRITAVIFLALSCVPSKRWHYLGPWYPFPALLAAVALVRRENAAWLRRAGRVAVGAMLLGVPLYYGVFQPYVLHEVNQTRAFVLEVMDKVPDGSVVLTFPGMGEELDFVGRARGKIPACRLVPVTETAAGGGAAPILMDEEGPVSAGSEVGAAATAVFAAGRPCYLVAKHQNLEHAAAALARVRTETVFEMTMEKDAEKETVVETEKNAGKGADKKSVWVLLRLMPAP